jgi:signal transduction histidine kinase
VANLPAGVFFVQGTAGRPILVNARARQLLGQLEDPSAGPDRLVEVYHLCRPDGTPYPTEELPVVGALRHGLTSMRDDIMVSRPDGQMMPLITWAAPVDLGSRDGGDAAVWVFEDLTALRRAEMELQRAQRLEVIGRLSSGIAHDFNNLLTVVLTLAQVIQDTLPPDHSAQQDLRRIAYAGEQAANLANQLLAFSKNRPAIPRRLDVNRVARRTLELLQATLPRLIKIESELADGELIVEADEMQLQQVLMNLCLNARDAMPKGGRLRVRTLKCSAADEVCLSVEDNGEGIPEDLQQRIFDPFFTTRERGTGLGLAMVRQIVERVGGRVTVWSRPGEGSRFDVSLPARA